MAQMQPQAGDTTTVVRPEIGSQTRLCPQWHVVLLDDDYHTYDYVIEMITKLFGHTLEAALQMAVEVDHTGRVVLDTTTKERAELKQQQIHEYGADWRIPECAGSMTCELEPAE